MSKHAYLIIAHSNFGQLHTLLEMLDDDRNDIFVHVDARARSFREEDFQEVCTHSNLEFVKPRIKVHWGGVSIMRVELALLEAASSKGRYDYYHLLSGMCLPIQTQDTIHKFFDEHQGKEFIELWQMKKTTPSRFHYITLFPEGAGFFLTNLCNNFFKGLQMALGFSINKDVDFKFASQWFSITDDMARFVLSKRDWLEKVFRRTNTCDEIFLPTLVWNTPFRDNFYSSETHRQGDYNSAMRFIDWSRGSSIRHPWTFLTADFDLLVNSPMMFARKFDERVDKEIIRLIKEKYSAK